jgi:hypothetical protein
MVVRLEKPLGVENGLVEPSPQAHPHERIYLARTLVQDHQEVPVRILNATHRDQKLTTESPLAHCEPVTLVTPPDVERSQARVAISKLPDLIAEARPHLSKGEFQDLKDLLIEYEDIFAGITETMGGLIKCITV